MKKNLFVCLLALCVAFVSCDKSDSNNKSGESVMTATQFSEYVAKITEGNKTIVEGEITAFLQSAMAGLEMYSYLSEPLPNITSISSTQEVMMMLYFLNQDSISILELIAGGLMNEFPQGNWFIDLSNDEGSFNLPRSADTTSYVMSVAVKVSEDSLYRFELQASEFIEIPIGGTDSILGIEDYFVFPSLVNMDVSLESGNMRYSIVSVDFATALYPEAKELVGMYELTLGNMRKSSGGFYVSDAVAQVFNDYITSGVKLLGFDVTMPCKNLVSSIFDSTAQTSVEPMTMKYGFANDAIVLNVDNIVVDKDKMKGIDVETLYNVALKVVSGYSSKDWKGLELKDLAAIFGVEDTKQVVDMVNNLLNLSISIPQTFGYDNPVARIQLFDEEGYGVLYYVCGDGSKVAVSQVPIFGYDTIYQAISAVVQKIMMFIMTMSM